MSTYVFAQYRRSPDYDLYWAAAAALNHKYGARVLTQSGTERCIEGEWLATAMVIIEFPSREACVLWPTFE